MNLSATIKKYWGLGRQIFMFALIGGVCYILVMGLLILFKEVFLMEVNLANAISSIIVIFINYFLNSAFVFEGGRHKRWKEMSGFFLFAMFGFFLNILLMYLFTEYLPVHYTVSKTIIVVLVAVFNFITRKYLIFKN